MSELSALCGAQLEIALGRGDREAAREVLATWEQTYPDDPVLRAYRLRLRGP